MNSRQLVLDQLNGKSVERPTCYSGMGNVTTAGLEQFGYKFSKVHTDAKMMADTAASSYKLFGYECAIVPYDLCLEAEAIGCVMNPYEEVDQLLYPTIKEKVCHSEEEMTTFPIPADVEKRGRVPMVCEAIKLLKADIGNDVAIGTYVLGPFTLAGQLMDLNDLFKLAFKKPKMVNEMLDRVSDVTIKIAKELVAAGADYINVREMGATTDVLSPKVFRNVIQPHLIKVREALKDVPLTIHICGGTNKIMDILHECKFNAISVETKNDLAASREVIGYEPLIFGNIDAFNVLVNGSPEDVEKATLAALEASCDAVWPSCDIWPTAPIENLKAMVDTVKNQGAAKWVRKNR
ncbi:MtaA/CmuA family methyltransferase [Phosphitispora fastidiosa]|uniref:MtaA/CmuA family methyltransferase n=1 Tax=Phosphitispora fastidiosa TaxID=2837202 RepID=UPI001E5A38FB|nr:MtaA/CmuA family methyltransferase [Phosphitispora fastidiosa]MBU7008013.1 [methyl-Co(III) methanol-specific corrinoid protein]:coenzyme M methyltransferase [Phosphitispora fastidiosa]